jgi:hypothetical protein
MLDARRWATLQPAQCANGPRGAASPFGTRGPMEVGMPAWLFHGWAEDAIAAAKAFGMFAVALVGLRVAPRRTLSQWTAIDVAAAVALGAIIGRTAIAKDQSLAVGAAMLRPSSSPTTSWHSPGSTRASPASSTTASRSWSTAGYCGRTSSAGAG